MASLFDKVKIISNIYFNRGLSKGAEGYIIEDFGDGNYDVEFSTIEGETKAILILNASEFEVIQ